MLCLDAAETSVAIVRKMRDGGLLSSLVLFDSWCIQELAHVFTEGLDTCMTALGGHGLTCESCVFLFLPFVLLCLRGLINGRYR